MPPRQPPRRGAGGSGRPTGRSSKPASSGGKPTGGSGGPKRAGDRQPKDRARGQDRDERRGNRSEPPKREPRANREPDQRTKSWGGVAKRGVGKLKPSVKGTASEAWREAAKESDRRERSRHGGTGPDWAPEEWIDAGPVREEAERAVKRGTDERDHPKRPRRERGLPDEVRGEVARAAGPAWAGRVQDRLNDAAQAFERERYRDALKLLKPLSERAPSSPAIRELLGLTLYRLGRWRDAIKELETAEALTGSVDHHPVLADCHRALGRHGDVQRLWDELRRAGAGVDVVIEGRIVLAGDLADQNRVREAIEILEQGPVNVRKPKDHHLRLWYALAATYERAGEVPRARRLFRRVAEASPDFADAYDRYDALG